MQVEHITLQGNTALRDTAAIDDNVVEALSKFIVGPGRHKLKFPAGKLDVKISVSEAGAIFDIHEAGRYAFNHKCLLLRSAVFERDVRERFDDREDAARTAAAAGPWRMAVLDHYRSFPTQCGAIR